MGKKYINVEYWERQQKETDPAWEAFQIYRDMGESRGLRAVAQKLSKSTALINRWSARHKWVARCEDYSRWQETQKRKAKEKALAEQGRREITLGKGLQALGQAQIARFKPQTIINEEGEEEIIFRETMSAFDARMCIESGSRLVKTGLGEPDSKHRLEVEGKVTFADLAEKARNAKRKREQ